MVTVCIWQECSAVVHWVLTYWSPGDCLMFKGVYPHKLSTVQGCVWGGGTWTVKLKRVQSATCAQHHASVMSHIVYIYDGKIQKTVKDFEVLKNSFIPPGPSTPKMHLIISCINHDFL